ncbi:MAG TPA: GNAT family N-acetyltransferase [Planctomycetota bacterium]
MKGPLARYPKTLEGGFVVRPLRAADAVPLAAFFKRIPVDECRLFKHDVRDAAVLRGWCRKPDYGRILPLLAWKGRRVVGDASLHRIGAGWSRHVARLSLTLDPAVRGRGLGRALLREFIELAPALDVAILHAQVLDIQKGARALFEGLDFEAVGTLPRHAIDLAGRVHDILLYDLILTPPERLAPEAALREDEADIGGSA